jgi:hypothetical protein
MKNLINKILPKANSEQLKYAIAELFIKIDKEAKEIAEQDPILGYSTVR